MNRDNMRKVAMMQKAMHAYSQEVDHGIELFVTHKLVGEVEFDHSVRKDVLKKELDERIQEYLGTDTVSQVQIYLF